MSILDAVEHSLRDFRPKNHRQFVLLNIAKHFDDLSNLAKYLNVADRHPKNVLLEAARLADLRGIEQRRLPSEIFFELLATWRREDHL